jgi:hypothetical protein
MYVHRSLSLLHPWQSDPPLPNHVTIDLSHHHPKQMHCPQDWEVMQRNDCQKRHVSVQYRCSTVLGVLINLKSRLSNDGPSEVTLYQLTITCLAQ